MNLIRIKAFPNAKKPAIEETAPQVLRVFVREDAQQNRANDAVIRAVADYYTIPKNKLRMISGHQKQGKLIQILE
jgi:uncharacterized protein YggU (UPF0235/DUF167 family)